MVQTKPLVPVWVSPGELDKVGLTMGLMLVCRQGGWKDDLKHGLGRKVYANGDVYEGLWALGKPDGPGRCAVLLIEGCCSTAHSHFTVGV